ncbi:MAG: ORF6N domain-containing protein [bacterium]|nr:ORF6N domain-containing protein [Candidatus Colisoma equi]
MGCDVIATERVRSLLVAIRGQMVLLDRDVAALYEVQTKEVNQAVRNNPDKFPDGFVFQLNSLELENWKSKILTSNLSEEELSSVKMGMRKLPYAFTERGLYMLATILKGRAATRATLAIVDTYARVREMSQTMEALQRVQDGGEEQRSLLQKTGELLADIVGRNLATKSCETEIEFNFALVKIRRRYVSTKGE